MPEKAGLRRNLVNGVQVRKIKGDQIYPVRERVTGDSRNKHSVHQTSGTSDTNNPPGCIVL